MARDSTIPGIKWHELENLFKVHRQLTADNHHGAALKFLARWLGLTGAAHKLEQINQAHARAGHLTPDLEEQRNAISKKSARASPGYSRAPIFRTLKILRTGLRR